MTFNATISKIPNPPFGCTSFSNPKLQSIFDSKFETKAPNDPQMNLNTAKRNDSYYVVQMFLSLNFNLFRSTMNRFQSTGQFATSVPNDLKMTLNTKRSNVPYICCTSVHEFQSHSLINPFRVTVNLKAKARNDPNATEHCKLKANHIRMLVSLAPKFQSISL